MLPTISRPLRQRLDSAKTLTDLLGFRSELKSFKVLDPACGSGNFLYVAYRELARIELDLVERGLREHGLGAARELFTTTLSTRNFYGIDSTPFASELAKVTLVLAKELSLLEARDRFKDLEFKALERGLPLDNLDSNIICADALFTSWPKVDAIIGNPPFQSKNKMQKEFGPAYVNKVRARYEDVPGRADYCVYWFRRAHEELEQGKRAGLVGTNTIRQNYSREGGLDYIISHDGTITEAVSTEVWSGDAVVHVSIVNWIKGEPPSGVRTLFVQVGNQATSPWEIHYLPVINSSLSASLDLASATPLRANKIPKTCFQGQTHGHDGFLLGREE